MTIQPVPVGDISLLALSSLEAVSVVRALTDDDHVARLMDVLEDCPPICVTSDGALVDGAHRVAAARKLGWAT